MSRSGTSIPEQSIFYYIKKFFPDAQNRYIYKDTSGKYSFEVDVFIPSIKIAVEYDGEYWHRNRKDIDSNKNSILNKDGIYVIRVRDLTCPKLPDFDGKIFYHGKAPNGMHTNEYIQAIMHDIAQFCIDSELANDLNNFVLTFKDYINDQPDILSLLYFTKVPKNKSKFCGAEYWDSSANGRLKLQNIPADSQRFFVNYKCRNNKCIHSTIDCLIDKKHCKKTCTECFNSICPFIWNCKEIECPIILNYFENFLMGTVQTKIDCNSNAYVNVFQSPQIFYFIRQRLNNYNVVYIDRFNQLFHFPRLGTWQTNINITSIEDLKIIIDYAKKAGGLTVFNLKQLECSNEYTSLLSEYFNIAFNLINTYTIEEKYGNDCWYYVDAIYFDWKKHKAEMALSIQKIVVDFLKEIELKITDHHFKYE